MEIRIVSYEDMEKYHTEFYPLPQNQTDEELKASIIRKASNYLDFDGIKKPIEILDKTDIAKIRNNEIIVLVENFYFLCN